MACARVRDCAPEFLLRRSIEFEREIGDSWQRWRSGGVAGPVSRCNQLAEFWHPIPLTAAQHRAAPIIHLIIITLTMVNTRHNYVIECFMC